MPGTSVKFATTLIPVTYISVSLVQNCTGTAGTGTDTTGTGQAGNIGEAFNNGINASVSSVQH